MTFIRNLHNALKSTIAVSFLLFSTLAFASPINVGDVINDTIDAAGEVDQYEFTASQGDTLFFDVQSGSSVNFTWQVLSPTNQALFSSSFYADKGPIVLTESGEYVLSIASNNNRTGSYQVQVVNVPATSSTAIDLNVSIEGEISVQGEQDAFTFSLSEDHVIYFDRVSGNSAGRWALFDANDNEIFNGQFVDVQSLSLVASDYRLVLRGNGDDTFAYSFIVAVVPPVSLTNINVNDIVSGEISVQGEVDEFAFSLNEPADLFFDRISGASTSISWTLFDANRQSIFANTFWTDQEIEMLPTGSYILQIDGRVENTTPYEFQIAAIPEVSSTPITLDEQVSGEITVQGEKDAFTFSVSDNQEVFFDRQQGASFSISWSLTNDQGEVIFDIASWVDIEPTILPSGNYTLLIDGKGDDQPTYQFQIHKVPETQTIASELYLGAAGEIKTPGERQRFEFDIEEPTLLGVERLSGTLGSNYSLKLLDAEDVLIDTRGSFASSTTATLFNIQNIGRYSIEFDGNGDTVGAFNIRLWPVDQPEPKALTLDSIETLRLPSQGYSREYQFTATAGNPLFLNVDYRDAPRISFSLIAPNGRFLFLGRTDDANVTSLPETGTYRLIASSSTSINAVPTGNTSFIVSESNDTFVSQSAAELQITSASASFVSTDSPANISLTYTVTNNGSVATNVGAWKDQIQFYSDNEFRLAVANVNNAFDFTIPVELDNAQVLAPGESYTKDLVIAHPLRGQTVESFEIIITADIENAVYEASSDLNQFTLDSNFIFFEERPTTGTGAIALDIEDGSLLPANTPIVLSGTANLSGGAVNVYFVMDNSASTSNPSGFDANGDGSVDELDDFNGDGRNGDVLDVEISSAINIAKQVEQSASDTLVSVVPFNDNASALDLGPERFKQSFIRPDEQSVIGDDTNLDFALKNNVGRLFGTNFGAAISELLTQVRIAPPADQTIVFFLTDGQALNNANAEELQALAEFGITLFAFQINNNTITNSLQNIVDGINAHSNSIASAQSVVNPGDLPSLVLQSLALANVEINGAEVEALDAAGNFFSTVTLNEGANEFTIAALDSDDNRIEKRITLFGASANGDGSTSLEASQSQVVYDNVYFNRASNRLFVDAKLQNNGALPINDTVTVTLQTDPVAVRVSNADGETTNGLARVFFDDELGAGVASGEKSSPFKMILANPRRDRFSINGQALSAANSAPYFANSPIVSIEEGEEYNYLANAIDDDGDVLTYALELAPIGMQINEQTGQISWQPSQAQSGTHLVSLNVTDGKGGLAKQSYQLSVTTNVANLPPFITSTPKSLLLVDEAYAYQVAAIDPEGSTLLYELDSAPLGISINESTGLIQAAASSLSVQAISLELTVTDNQGGQAQQNWILSVRAENQVPVIVSDPITSVSAEASYFYAVQVDDDDSDLVFELNTAPLGLRINSTTGALSMSPTQAQIGEYDVEILVTDPFGAFAVQSFILQIVEDNEAPQVSIVLNPTEVALGQSTVATVIASDNAGLDSVSLTYLGVEQSLDGNNSVSITPSEAGEFVLSATAVDISGLSSDDTASLRVFDIADNDAPIVSIESPEQRSTASFLTDIIGTIEADDLREYVLQYALASEYDALTIADEGPQWTTFAEGTQAAQSALLGTFDPTILRNDDYVVRLLAEDINGNKAAAAIFIGLTGESKIGVFQLTYTDLSIPISNIPIEINRVYRSTDAAVAGELGYGWHFQFSNPDIRETIPVAEMEETLGLFVTNPYSAETRVYLNAPDGKRIGFTFDPEPVPSLFGNSFVPKFIPDPGVFYELEVDPVTISQTSDGNFVLFLLSFNYNPQNFTLIEPNGTKWQYNQFRGLNSVSDRNGNELVYTDEGIFHSSGIAVRFDRDTEGRIVAINDPEGDSLQYEYNSLGELVSFTDRMGQTETYTYLDSPQHFMEQLTDVNGNITRIEFDDDGRLAGTVDGLGNRIAQAWEPESFMGTITDAKGQVTLLEYDLRGNIIREEDPLGNAKTYVIDANNNETRVTDENGNTTEFAYDEMGNVIAETNALGFTSTFGFDEFANQTSVVNPLGHAAQSVFDENGNLISLTMPDGSVFTYVYDIEGRLISMTDAVGNQTTYEYTGSFITPTRVTLPDGNTQLRTLDQRGFVTSITDEIGNTVTITRDANGRAIQQVDADGHLYEFVYEGNLLVTIRYPAGQSKFFDYNASNQLIRTRFDDGTEINFAYDPNGNVTSVVDIDGNITSYDYDALDRKVTRTDATGASERYEYDAIGNLIAKTDRRGYKINYQYDALNRLLAETWLDSNDDIVWQLLSTYDALGNVLSMNDGSSNITNTYDANNRVLTHEVSIVSGPTSTLSMLYDGNDKLIEVSDSASSQRLSYNNRQLLSSIALAADSKELAADINYDPRGLRASLTRKLDTATLGTSSYAFNARHLAQMISHDVNGTIYGFDYVWDGNRRVSMQTQDTETIDYSYDNRDQLLTANRSENANEQYSFDANGNPSDDASIGEGNRLLSQGDIDYTYDDAGNMLTRTDNTTGQVASFTYDHRSRLTAVKLVDNAGVTISDIQYSYDALDRRVKRSVNNDVAYTNYVMSDAWTDMEVNGDVSVRYLNGANTDEKLARLVNGDAAWYLTDKQQSVHGLVDSNGNMLNEIDYDSFGKIISQTNPLEGDRFTFTGREYEADINVYDYRARAYDPAARRFISEDPIGFEANDANLYRYVFNNPLNATDPSGKSAAQEYGVILCKIVVPQAGQYKVVGQCLSDLYEGIGKGIASSTANDGLVLEFGGCIAKGIINNTAGEAGGAVNSFGGAVGSAINNMNGPGGFGGGSPGDAAIALACGAF
ncbi:RHS repeat-associated core domain-containing protein [Glaciecola petra]|uniref:RHS repeat-associated core domain-containing protein n=1 Tax=Glaciecola petra TaxID=3075602 RepID=A0ABU2ZQP6_9ALTE|nr:RHS repeat-associated core domain-containing protein [Aestuariibacter sp. P117]MDT0594942.1 RHS repeat-associated core domain-containing protein [Aestuariibacter sp. P117]